MAHIRKGILKSSKSWNKHFDKFMKKWFWSMQKQEAEKLIRKEIVDENSTKYFSEHLK